MFKRLVSLIRRKPVTAGVDSLGNTYYESRGSYVEGRPKRFVVFSLDRTYRDEFQQMQEVPVQWQSWLRHTREAPPSVAELKNWEERQRLVTAAAKIADGETTVSTPRVRKPTHKEELAIRSPAAAGERSALNRGKSDGGAKKE